MLVKEWQNCAQSELSKLICHRETCQDDKTYRQSIKSHDKTCQGDKIDGMQHTPLSQSFLIDFYSGFSSRVLFTSRSHFIGEAINFQLTVQQFGTYPNKTRRSQAIPRCPLPNLVMSDVTTIWQIPHIHNYLLEWLSGSHFVAEPPWLLSDLTLSSGCPVQAACSVTETQLALAPSE